MIAGRRGEVDQLFGWDYKAGVEREQVVQMERTVHDDTLQQGRLKLLPNV